MLCIFNIYFSVFGHIVFICRSDIVQNLIYSIAQGWDCDCILSDCANEFILYRQLLILDIFVVNITVFIVTTQDRQSPVHHKSCDATFPSPFLFLPPPFFFLFPFPIPSLSLEVVSPAEIEFGAF